MIGGGERWGGGGGGKEIICGGGGVHNIPGTAFVPEKPVRFLND